MNTRQKFGHGRRLAALAAGSVTSVALLSALLAMFAGVEPMRGPLWLAAACGLGAGCDAPGAGFEDGDASHAGLAGGAAVDLGAQDDALLAH